MLTTTFPHYLCWKHTEIQILKNFVHFLTRSDPSKILLHNTPTWNRAFRKIQFFQIFHCKTMYYFQKSQFYNENVFFWGTTCWCSSKTLRMVGGQIYQFWLNWPPYHSCNFWATPTYCTSKEHIFNVELRFLKNMNGLTMKNLKKIRFSWYLDFT